jgi:nitric oxide reductase NorQ protein
MSEDIRSILEHCYSNKPEKLMISELKWKYLIRSILKGKNILIVGPRGCGKTIAARYASQYLNREFIKFNLGASQDPRGMLIGNTVYKKEEGTVFNESRFISAIKKENSVILLDELSRAHPDAWNILMTVLDEMQRYVALDEKEDGQVINVSNGVCFIATANIGSEYTATRILDKALLDRFVILEMDELTKKEELKLIELTFPSIKGKEHDIIQNICEISEHIKKNVRSDNSKLSTTISTRQVIEMASLVEDGFNLLEIAESMIYPNFPDDGGSDSERVFIKQLLQKYSEPPIIQTNKKNPNKIKSTPPVQKAF